MSIGILLVKGKKGKERKEKEWKLLSKILELIFTTLDVQKPNTQISFSHKLQFTRDSVLNDLNI